MLNVSIADSRFVTRRLVVRAAAIAVMALCVWLSSIAHPCAYADTYAVGEVSSGTPATGLVSIEPAVVSVKNQVYDGKAKTPAVKVKLGADVLVQGRDYTVEYKDNKERGVAQVAVHGAGGYTGDVPATFIIFSAQKGWQTIGESKFYLTNAKGKVAKGWKKINGKRYYFDKTTGVMLTGLTTIGATRYYFDKKTGAAQSGWFELGSAKKRYYFNSKTYAAAKGKVTIDNARYYFSSAGVLKKKWFDESGHKEGGVWVVDRAAGWYPVVTSHSNGHLFHQRQGNDVNCGATSFIVGVNILLGQNKYTDNVAVWSSKQFKKNSVDHLGNKGQAWLKANGLADQIKIWYIPGDIHKTKRLRSHLKQGHVVIMCSGSKSEWRLSDGSTMNDHPTGHWIVFYHYANGVYYANDSRHDASKGAGCIYTEAQMQKWLDGRSNHAAIAMQSII